MPRGKKADDRLASLERHLDSLEAVGGSRLERRERTNAEVVEIALILLAHVHEGDVEAFAKFLAQDPDLPFEKAEEIARGLGRILEMRRAGARTPDILSE